MSKDDQAIKAISDMLARLRNEMAAYLKSAEDKIAALELTYQTLTGQTPPKEAVKNGRRSRRHVKIDRHGAQKAYEFLKDRGDKPTSVKMVARKFSITEEAASQRLLKLHREGKAARYGKGQYIDASQFKNGVNAHPEA